MHEIICASDVNAIMTFILYELNNHRSLNASGSNTSVGTSATASWFNTLITLLAKGGKTVSSVAAGGSITKSKRDEIISRAKELYDTLVPR